MKTSQYILPEMVIPIYFADRKFGCEGNSKEYLFVVLMPSHSKRVTFGHIEFHLSIRSLFCLFLSGRLRQVLLYLCTTLAYANRPKEVT